LNCCPKAVRFWFIQVIRFTLDAWLVAAANVGLNIADGVHTPSRSGRSRADGRKRH
jgi:hypothetical protein